MMSVNTEYGYNDGAQRETTRGVNETWWRWMKLTQTPLLSMSSFIRQQQSSLSTEDVPLISNQHQQFLKTLTKLDDESKRLLQVKNVAVSLHRPSSRPYQSYFLQIRLIITLLLWPSASAGPVGEQGWRLLEYWSKPENATRLSQMKFIPAYSSLAPPLSSAFPWYAFSITSFTFEMYGYPFSRWRSLILCGKFSFFLAGRLLFDLWC